jgi:WD40 repeat protein
LGIFTGFEFAGPVYSVTYAPLSHDLIWVSRGTAMVQNMDSQQISTTFYHEDFINSYTLNADGSMLVVATARTWEGNYHPGIQVWNRNTGEDLGFITTESLARGLALTNDGSLLFGSDGNKLCAWNPASGALVAAFEGHQDLISFVSLSPDNRRILTGSFDNTVILWGVQP